MMPNSESRKRDQAAGVEALAEWLYRGYGWSGCPGSAWARLPDGAKDGWRFAARVRAETLAEVERAIKADRMTGPGSHDPAARFGYDVARGVVVSVLRGMAEAGDLP